jgi:hypothetical protein
MLLHPVKGGLIDTRLSIPTPVINFTCLEFVAILLSIADDDDDDDDDDDVHCLHIY